MALTFVNIKSGERRVCHTEPMIAAHLNTSDRNPNAMQGQDMGWRLAPETVIELERIVADPVTLQTIAATFGILLESVSESDILTYISMQNRPDKTGSTVSTTALQRQYEDDIRRLRERDAKIEAEAQAKGERKKVKPIVQEEPSPQDDGLDNLEDIEEINEEIDSTETEESATIPEGEGTNAKPVKKANNKKES